MSRTDGKPILEHGGHSWLRQVHACCLPGPAPTQLTQAVVAGILDEFKRLGHIVQARPDDRTDLILTTAPYGKPVSWRSALLLTSRMRFRLSRSPVMFTLVHIQPRELDQQLERLTTALAKDEANPTDYAASGLAPEAHRVLREQGRRGGAILAFERLVQAQTKCINLLLLVGDAQPQTIYHFDLVGAYPQSRADDADRFYRDVVLRMVTRVSTYEISQHQPAGEPISVARWSTLETPAAMYAASRELDQRGFFTEMVRISDLVHIPAVQQAISSQYSEGCFATWDAELSAMVATVTGSARPVNKGEISRADLSVITGIRDDGLGALLRPVEGLPNDPPSSEAVEMFAMDQHLPRITLTQGRSAGKTVPVIRSKLHGHRGVTAYDPDMVEFVPLDPAYYAYPVTCGTAAQAAAIQQAFDRSAALNQPDDPRQVVFTMLPTHGVVIAEKWAPHKAPFQLIWEHLDAGRLVIAGKVPQGALGYQRRDGLMHLQER
jgi:hypothetical protein